MSHAYMFSVASQLYSFKTILFDIEGREGSDKREREKSRFISCRNDRLGLVKHLVFFSAFLKTLKLKITNDRK